jgi:dTDP-glucose pyrophosphorylase/predicted transcriptional regulator
VYDWTKIILNQSATMRDAIEVLNSEALRIVLVVDTDERLVGTITDGDIRRALLRHSTMDIILSELMNTEPTIANLTDGRDQLLQKMQELDLLQIPVVDSDGQVTGLETLQHLLEKKRYDNPVFLMAGGFGTRLRPLTEHTPKPMLNVGTKPILETILEQFIETGFYNFFISTHYMAEVVHAYFGDGSEWNVSIQYVHEKEPLGTAGALGLLPKNLPDLPIVMMNGDLLTKVDFIELLSYHNEHGGDATMCVREYDYQVPYGVVKADEHRITSIVEKPVQKFFVNAGIYVLAPSILNGVDGEGFLDMPHLLSEKIKNNEQVNMFPLHEYWLDIGQMEQFEQAQIDSRNIFQ